MKLEWKWFVDATRPIPSPRGEAHDLELDVYFTVHPVSDGSKLWAVYVKTQGMFEKLTRKRLARGQEGAVKLCEEYRQVRVAAIATANGYVKAESPITSAHDPRFSLKKGEPWHIDIGTIARSAGYVKRDDYEALKLKLAEVTDQLKDATDTLDQIESESHLFHATAIASGYVKLEPGQVVVDKELADGVLLAVDMVYLMKRGNLHECHMTPDAVTADIWEKTRDAFMDAIKEARDA